MKISPSLISSLVAAALSGTAFAGTLTGMLKDEAGDPVAGAIVTLSDKQRGVSESVYTDASGRFSLTTRLVGDKAALRVRKPYFMDLAQAVSLPAKGSLKRSLTLKAMRSEREISESLPAAYHFGQLAFVDGTLFRRDKFQRDCLSCHQLGNAYTRTPRDAAAWEATIERMHSYLGDFDKDLKARRAEILAKGFDGQPIKTRPVFPFDKDIARARIVQYRLDQGKVPHDAEVSPVDGLVYTVDQFGDFMAITDLKAGTTKYVPAPQEGMPPGGKFTKLGIPGFGHAAGLVHRGPHSLAFGPDGKWYTTDTFATRIGVFNPGTQQWEKSFDIPDAPSTTLYPHTIRFDKAGYAWFTLAFSEQVARLDPRTGKMDVIALPPAKSQGISAGTAPYGIDVSPRDGKIWYARLWGDKVGCIDPDTLAVTEYDSPVKGPRRLRFDQSGALWIAGYSEGMIARIEPEGFKAKVYPLPEFAPGFRPAPYALAIHPKTQEVWVNETMTDHMYRFLPKEERWVAYPVPLRGTYTREVSFTREGQVCTSNNPFPAAALEGGVNELICIEPDGAAMPGRRS